MWKKYFTIKEAAEYLDVSAQTLRNWDVKGNFRAFRNPLNKYRLYRGAELEKLSRNRTRKAMAKLVDI